MTSVRHHNSRSHVVLSYYSNTTKDTITVHTVIVVKYTITFVVAELPLYYLV